MRKLEKELVKLREQVRRSKKLSQWEKYQAYQRIVEIAKLMDLED